MTLIKLPQLWDTYDTVIYGIDRVNGVLYAVYPVSMKRLGIRGRIEKEGTPPAMPKPYQSTLLSRVTPQPQATSMPAMGAAPIDLSGTVINERTIASAPRNDEQVGHKRGIDVENLSNATSTLRLSVDNPLHIHEMEYIEVQRHQKKVRAKLENLHCNWSIERTLVPANESPLVDEAYQRQIAKYKFIADCLAGIS